jgi:hypothetical protein
MGTENNPAHRSPASPVAAGLCLFGCFLYLILSEPLLNALGFHYTDGNGPFFQKIHPGAILVFISFAVLFIGRERPQAISREYPAPTFLLATILISFIYSIARSGAHGIGFLIDTHMVVPMIAIVLAYAPRSYARRGVLCFVAFAALDAIIGIGEFMVHSRIFSVDPHWATLHESSFRISSLMGSPLASDLFLPVALFAALGVDLPRGIKIGLIILLPLALMAFGGSFAFVVTTVGLTLLGAGKVLQSVEAEQMTVRQASFVAASFCIGVTFVIMHILDSPSESAFVLADYRFILDSQSRAFGIFHQMSLHELVFGVSTSRIANLASAANIAIPAGDIESPWVLMFLVMGGGFFILWTVATVNFLCTLMRRRSLALICATLAYFIIASTSNSFGRKDVLYPSMIALMACATASASRRKAG